MIKETITFTDYNGNEVTKEYHFNLSPAEIAEMHISYGGEGDFKSFLEKIVESKDGKAIIENFKMILRMATGIKSEDGLRFSKSKAIENDFMESPAYSKIFLRLVTDTPYAVNFINGIFPKEVIEEAERLAAVREESTPDIISKDRVADFKTTDTVKIGEVIVPVTDVRVTELEDTRPAWVRENRRPTKAELRGMSREQLVEAMGTVASE